MLSFDVHVLMTGKPMGNNQQDYTVFAEDTHNFETMEEVKTWLKETYGNCKKSKMYIDYEEGESEHVGWVYHFRNEDISHYPVEKWYQQDWVSIYEVETSRVVW